MTRYEILQRFAEDERTHRDHVATFHVLTEMWFSAGMPESFDPNRNELIRLLKTRPRNVSRWLAELETFGFIAYQRGKNQHQGKSIRLVGSVPNGTAQGFASVPNGTAQGFATVPNGTATNLPVSEMAQHEASASVPNGIANPVVVSQMAQRGSVPNGTATAPEGQKRSFESLETGETSILVHNNNHLIKEVNSVLKGNSELVSSGKGVRGKNQKRKVEPGHKFIDSPYFDLSAFRSALASDRSLQGADLDHYHARLLSWRDTKGAEPLRADWLTTARKFVLNDIADNRLVTVTTVKPLHNASRNTNNPTGSIIQPPAIGERRRFGSW